MSRDRAKVRFRTILDPGLLLFPSDANGGIVKGKGKDRADSGISNKTRSNGRKPISRVNSLVLSTQSPKYIRAPEKSRGQASTSTLFSTIGTFESSGSSSSSIGEGQVHRHQSLMREEDNDGRTENPSSSSTKRKRAIESISEPSYQQDLILPVHSNDEMPLVAHNNTADEEWENIWERWNTQKYPSQAIQNSEKDALTDLPEVTMQDANKVISSSQHSQLSFQSQDQVYETTWSIHQHIPTPIELEKEMNQSRVDKSIAWTETEGMDDSRSRIDEGLLLGSLSSISSIEEAEEDNDYQYRLDIICNGTSDQMQSVRHTIFQGSSVQAHFAPAWDGYQLRKLPPSRSDLVEWSTDKTSEGRLYDYEDMDLVPLWND